MLFCRCNYNHHPKGMQSYFGKMLLQQFYRRSTISNKLRNCKLQLGFFEGQQTVMKIIQCTAEEELFYRQILSKRQATSLYIKPQSWLQTSNRISTIVDQAGTRQRRYLLILTPYISRTEPTSYTNTSLSLHGQRLTLQQKAIRVVKMIIKAILVLITSSNHQLYTYDSFLLDPDQPLLTINKASFVGMRLLLRNEPIQLDSFKEIMGILQSDTLDKPPEQRLNLQVKFRGLANLLISLIMQRKVSLFYGSEMWSKLESDNSLQTYKQFLRNLRVKYDSFLRINQVSTKIATIERILNIRISEFLKRLLVDEEKLSWAQVCKLLVPKRPRKHHFEQQPQILSQKIAEEIYSLLPLTSNAGKILSQLGIEDPQTYLIVLLYGQDTPMSLLLTEFHLDDYFFTAQNFKPENMELYKRMIQIISVLLSQNGVQFWALNQRLLNENIVQMSFDEIEEYKELRSQDNRFNRLQKTELLFFLMEVTKNFSVYRTVNNGKKFITNTQQAKAIKIYSKLFA